MRFLFLLFYTSFSFGQNLILSPGEKTWIPLPGNQTVRVGDKSLLLLQKEDNRISLIAKKQGRTLLTANNNRYEIFIFDRDNKIKALLLENLLKQLWGLNWSLSKENVFEIKGRLYRFSDWLDIMKECKKHNISYHFRAEMDEELKKISSYYFKKFLKQEIQVNWSELPSVFVPTGSPLSNYENSKAFGLTPIEKKLWFFKAPLAQIDLAIVETLSSSVFSAGGSLLKPLSHFSSLLSFLNFLKSSGQGKTLHHSSLVGQSGKEIQLKSGGQIPFYNYSLKTEQKNTSWKSHGLQINLTPSVGYRNQIKLNIKTQLSEPLSFSSSDQAPPLKTQNLESEFVLNDNQILKIFQLYKKSTGKQYKGQLGFLEANPNFLLGGKNNSKMTQSVFIQVKILKEQPQPNNLKEVL